MTYPDATLPVSRRVADLLDRMTLDEKLAQLSAYWMRDLLEDSHRLSSSKLKRLLALGIGQITRAGGSSVFGPVESARTTNTIQHYLVNETRLGIPAIVHEECCAGYMALGGTMFPQMIGLASTFQPELAQAMTDTIRIQMRAVGAHQGLAPVLDVTRDPRWGRVEETFGEDPTLVSQFGMAYIRGLQGTSLKYGGVMATGKHFIGHGASQGGMNCAPAHIGRRELMDIYAMPFEAAIRKAGLHTIMNAYPELDGELVAASRHILTDLLRGELGFEGLVVSDYDAILMIQNYHHMVAERSEAAALALRAGIQVELPSAACYSDDLRLAIQAGNVPMEWVNAAVCAHLQKKFELGLFENPYVDEGRAVEVFETPEQRGLARRIAAQSLVLLSNNGLLPLQKDLGTLALIGPNADSWRNLVGDYSYPAQLEELLSISAPDFPLAGVKPADLAGQAARIPTILEAIQETAPALKLVVARGCDTLDPDTSGFAEALRAAQAADAVVLVLGDHSGLSKDSTTGETRDSADLRLPGVQNELAQAVLQVGKPTAVVLVNGRPFAIPELAGQADALLEAWLPGEEGAAALAQALFGELTPGGKLPISIPRHVGQVPLFYNQKPSGGKSMWHQDYVSVPAGPLYPFGHGLSYTTFEYGDLTIAPAVAAPGGSVQVSLSVRNSGKRAGDEVVQLYVCDEYGCVPRPVKELKGYKRLTLQPGQSRRLTFRLPVNQLAFYDDEMHLVVEPGRIRVMLGSSSADIRCEGSFEIGGKEKAPVQERIFECPVEVGEA
ncbi:MAG TPA: glycoside hydrolase family 3 N-terminal domain-containing protein [Anaerolineales bacterium]|nr:glycoside hydrolase family 3 N-terminal domain-containing protein [Anaerolineales bacterium]